MFNGARYLRGCLTSIIRQTFRDFELVISDNASQDETPAICQELAARDARVRYVRNPTNIGIMENFAAVVGLARGELFAWIGSDDIWDQGFLETLVEALDGSPDASLACGNYDWIDDAGESRRLGSVQLARWAPKVAAPYLRLGGANGRLHNLCLYWWWRNPFPIYGLFRRASLIPLLPFEYLFADCRHADNLMLLRFLLHHDLVVVDRVLFHYRLKEREFAGPGSYYAAGARTDVPAATARPTTEERALLDRVLRAVEESTLSPVERGILRLAFPVLSRVRKGCASMKWHLRGSR